MGGAWLAALSGCLHLPNLTGSHHWSGAGETGSQAPVAPDHTPHSSGPAREAGRIGFKVAAWVQGEWIGSSKYLSLKKQNRDSLKIS